MKPETSERLFIEDLFRASVTEKKVDIEAIESIERLTGDASTRRYYRIYCTHTSYVVCLDNPSDDENTFVRKQRFLEKNQVRVPMVYDCIPSKGYILEEDLGDVTLIQNLARVSSREEEKNLYTKIIDQLIKIHSINTSESSLFLDQFDEEKLMQEIDFSIKFFIGKRLGDTNLDLHKKVASEFRKICKNIASKEMVLTHRDFHSRNVMVKGDELIIIDFQDARMGIPQYDLASLLDDCYYEIDDGNKNDLLKYYFDNTPRKDQETFEEFLLLYNEIALQRVFKAIGSFSYIYELRADERYLKWIGFAMEKLKKILFTREEYSDLRVSLFEIYYES